MVMQNETQKLGVEGGVQATCPVKYYRYGKGARASTTGPAAAG